MDNGPRRHPTYSIFVTEEQAKILKTLIDQDANIAGGASVNKEWTEAIVELKRKVVNLLGAIKRRGTKESSHGKTHV